MSNDRPTALDELHALRHACMDWRLARGDLAVYAVLLKHADAGREAYPGPKRISSQAAIAVSNVKVSLRRLEDLKYIRVIRPGLRKANRYVISDSPAIPSKEKAAAMREIASLLGMQAGPDPRRPRAASNPQRTRNLGMQAGPDDARGVSASRHAGMTATGYARSPELGMRAGYELASELSSELIARDAWEKQPRRKTQSQAVRCNEPNRIRDESEGPSGPGEPEIGALGDHW
ncbi:hypothetical protein [Lysobacter sp. Root494]|uniref:hypothetical protein n=1 Tax=Lysobacter sp. Root494 TaxID=1736549 RepID=UPI000A650BE7|nr:hypothetical protein [Lysobacter sp. Root494]